MAEMAFTTTSVPPVWAILGILRSSQKEDSARRTVENSLRPCAGRTQDNFVSSDQPELDDDWLQGALSKRECIRELLARVATVFEGFVKKILRRKGIRECDLHDAYCKVVEMVVKKFEGFRGKSIGEFLCWVSYFCQTVARSYRAIYQKFPITSDLVSDDEDWLTTHDGVALDDMVAGITSDELEKLVRATLDNIPPRWAQALILQQEENMSCAEIAQAMGISEGRAKKLLSKGRRAFKDQWSASLLKYLCMQTQVVPVAPLAGVPAKVCIELCSSLDLKLDGVCIETLLDGKFAAFSCRFINFIKKGESVAVTHGIPPMSSGIHRLRIIVSWHHASFEREMQIQVQAR